MIAILSVIFSLLSNLVLILLAFACAISALDFLADRIPLVRRLWLPAEKGVESL